MASEWIEELLLVLIALCMLSYLLPFSLARNILATILIALALIGILVVRSVSRSRQETPYDWVILAGVALSLLYLLSFLAFEQSMLAAVTVTLFAIFFALMAALLGQHHLSAPHSIAANGPEREARVVKTTKAVREPARAHHATPPAHRPGDVHDSRFRQGIEPIPEHAPPRSWFRRVVTGPIIRIRERRAARRAERESQRAQASRMAPLGQWPAERRLPVTKLPAHKLTRERKERIRDEMFERGLEPIPEMEPPRPAKAHDAVFKRGIEPIQPVDDEAHDDAARTPRPVREGALSDAELRKLERLVSSPKKAPKKRGER